MKVFISSKYLLLIIVIISYTILSTYSYFSEDILKVAFLNIGQGDFTFVKTPNNNTILIDGGDNPKVSLTKFAEEIPFFKKTIDLIILTHSHSDHINGLIDIIDNYEVGAVLLNGVVDRTILYKTFLNKILEKEIPIYFAESREDFSFEDGVYLDILYPFTNQFGTKFSNLNNSSIVLNLIYKDKKILFTGDAEVEVLESLSRYEEVLQADVLKVSHHGASNGTNREFLKAVSPREAVLSYGEGNKFGHPHEETVSLLEEFGVEICRTVDGGCEIIED